MGRHSGLQMNIKFNGVCEQHGGNDPLFLSDGYAGTLMSMCALGRG